MADIGERCNDDQLEFVQQCLKALFERFENKESIETMAIVLSIVS